MLKALHTLFPTPAFLRMQAVGLDIADRRLRFLELIPEADSHTVGRFGELPVPPGVIVGGNVKRPNEIQTLLKKARRNHGLDFVRVSLPEERAYLVKIEVPDGEATSEEIETAILAQLDEHVPVPPEEAIFDYRLVPSSEKSPARQAGAGLQKMEQALVSVMTEKDVRQYLDMFSGTGITPVSFEIEAQALARAIIPRQSGKQTMIVDFGRTRAGVFIVENGVVHFTSTVDVGSDMLTSAIEKHFNVDDKEAEKIKNTRALSRNEKDKEFSEAVMFTIAALRDEINKIMIYWQTHSMSEKSAEKVGGIDSILLSGGGANLRGLADYLSAGLRVPVTTANPWENTLSLDEYIPPITAREALGYAPVIGLALGDTRGDF